MVLSKYRRALLKLSGEALEGTKGNTLDLGVMNSIAVDIEAVVNLGVQVAVVIGGGNFFRGINVAATGMNRAAADAMGMLATIMNCLAMKDVLVKRGLKASVMSAIPMVQVCDPFTSRNAIERLEKGEVVLLAAGTGSPYFTTDTAAALRALEIEADILLKATKVDGIYDKDPQKNEDAVRFDKITYKEVIERQLRVMDLTAVTLCRDNGLPMIVFNMGKSGNIRRVIIGENIGTKVIKEE